MGLKEKLLDGMDKALNVNRINDRMKAERLAAEEASKGYEQEQPLTYDKKKKKYEGGFSTISGTPLEGGNNRVTLKDGAYETDDSAGAGRGKGYAKGGRVTGFKGYGKAKKV